VGSALLVQLDGQMPEPLIVERATGSVLTLFCIIAATIGVFRIRATCIPKTKCGCGFMYSLYVMKNKPNINGSLRARGAKNKFL